MNKNLIDEFNNKKILITGGAGFIGSEIARRLLNYNPNVIRIFDNSEFALYKLKQELQDSKFRFFLGDIRDKDRLCRAIEDVDVVFHTAALKHVPLCEYNTYDAVKTNVIGTQNVIEASLDEEIEKLISISTDKAANPSSVMGATKLLAERLIVAANYTKGNKKTILFSIRFGNVIGSTGSVIPLFKEQIQKGESLTITNPDMTRFMMSVGDAVNLTLKACTQAKGGEKFILKMPALRIIDLAEYMIENSISNNEESNLKIKTKIVGSRPGEKIHEELMTTDEASRCLESDDMFIVLPNLMDINQDNDYPHSKMTSLKKYASDDTNLISKEEIHKIMNLHSKPSSEIIL